MKVEEMVIGKRYKIKTIYMRLSSGKREKFFGTYKGIQFGDAQFRDMQFTAGGVFKNGFCTLASITDIEDL